MSIKILIIEEIIKRLHNKILNDIHDIKIGSFSEVRTNNTLPVINVFLKNIREINSTFRGRSVNELDFIIRVVCNKLQGSKNVLYKKTGDVYEGPLFLFDKVLNCLDNNIKDNLDLSLNNTTFQHNGYDCEIVEDNDLIIFNINFFIKSNEFSYGQR